MLRLVYFDYEQIKDNIHTVQQLEPLTEAEWIKLHEIVKIYRDAGAFRCRSTTVGVLYCYNPDTLKALGYPVETRTQENRFDETCIHYIQ